jgi:glycosyltransferase involved in cell wall biosynthesis
MNILVVHNTYQQPGGEDVVVAQERRLLEQNGHTVALYTRSNHEIDTLTFGQRLGLVSRIISASDTRIAVRNLLRDLEPDIVHVHNTFAMVSPSVYEVCREEDVPVVQTLHNYRLLCPASTFYRNGGPCQECVSDGLFRSVQHACYRDSRAMSGVIALMLKAHRSRQTLNKGIDAYIATSRFVKEKFAESGFPADKIYVKPNFVGVDPGERRSPGDYALFVGRLSPEKGLATLLEAWHRLPVAVPLVIAGDGPMRQQLENDVRSMGLRNIRFAGRLNRDEVYDAMKKASFVVVPSIWYEPFGLVVAEAFACETPVLASRIGGIQEMLEDHATGLHFAPGDPDALAQKVAWAWERSSELAAMGKAGRRVYEQRYTANANYDLLMDIYVSAIEAHGKCMQPAPLRREVIESQKLLLEEKV